MPLELDQTVRYPRVIHPSELWSPGRLIFYSFLVGLSVYVSVLVVLLAALILSQSSMATFVSAVGPWGMCALGVLVVSVLPLCLLWGFRRMIRTVARTLISGLGCAAGVLSPLVVLSLGNPDTNHWRGVYLALGVTPLFLCTANLILVWVFRCISEPVIMQDGTRCPQCAYRLIGNVSMRCPECGREYTYQELGTTAERFRQALHLPDDFQNTPGMQ